MNYKNPRKISISYGIMLFSLMLFSANFVGDRSLQIFHFSYSAGTLIMQLVFCAVIFFCELMGERKTALLIGITALINVFVALIAYLLLDCPIPVFWSSQEEALWHRLNVTLMLSAGYFCSALAMVLVTRALRVFFYQQWLIFRIIVVLTIGFLIDCAILLPILYYSELDRYMALWKMISFASVKGSLTLVAMPFTFFAIYLLPNYRLSRKYTAV